MNRVVFDPIIPAPWIGLIGAAFVAATIYIYFSVGTRLSWWRNGLLAASRLLAVALVLLALLQPSLREEIPMSKLSNVLLVGVDASRSMNQADAAKTPTTRLQFAKETLRESGLLAPSETTALKLFGFDEDASSIATADLEALKAKGPSTKFHRSVQTMLGSLGSSETAKGMILLTDGHDLELTSAAKTAFLARSRRVPIYAVPLGARGLVRDASINITNYQPYSFVKQRSHITANIRAIGCEHENLTVQLLRQNQIIKSTEVNAGELSEIPVDFEVSEAEPGQYQYEVRVVPLPKETDVRNNTTLTFLNVIDQQIPVLLLEGAPYWDTSFLERSLFQNDKVALDAVLQYMPDKARRIRKLADLGELKTPQTKADFARYDVVILGRSVDKILGPEQLEALREFVHDHGGTVIFGRGKAYDPPDDLDPVTWGDAADTNVKLQAGHEGSSLAVFRTLSENSSALDALPSMLGARRINERKTLAAILAEARDPNSGAAVPAIIHRRYGRGQVLSVAVDGLWRWSFNPKTTATNNQFDRFWDQILVWLVAGGDFAPNRQFAFRANTANLLLGEKINLRLVSRDAAKAPHDVPVSIFYDDKSIARTSLVAAPDGQSVLRGDYLPEKTGRYRAVVTMPDGKPQEVKWMVYEDNPEEKEVAADVPYLKTLCESSGGRLLAPEELKSLAEKLEKPAADLKPKVRMTTVWDHVWVFYLLCFALALDWFLRRKWGLC